MLSSPSVSCSPAAAENSLFCCMKHRNTYKREWRSSLKNLFRLVVVARAIIRSRGESAASHTVSSPVSYRTKQPPLGSHDAEETGRSSWKEGSHSSLEDVLGSLWSSRELGCSHSSVHSSVSHHAHAGPIILFAWWEGESQVTVGEERRNGPEYI